MSLTDLAFVLLCAATVLLLVRTAYGPRRWYAAVTSHVRPGAAEPSPRGYRLLRVRDLVVVVVAIVITVTATVQRQRLTQDELYGAVENAVASIDEAPDIDESQLRAEVADELGRDVEVNSVTAEVRTPVMVEADDPTMTPVSYTTYYEVSTSSRTDRVGSDRLSQGGTDLDTDAPVVCVTVETERSYDGERTDSIGRVSQGRCD